MKSLLCRKLLFVLAIAVVLLMSCKSTTLQSDEVIVSAAASLKEAFEYIANDFEASRPGVKVILNFAGSQSLRMQIEQGAQVDVFASANHEHMAALVKSGHVISGDNFAENALVIVTPADDQRLKRFEDLPSVERLVLGSPEVPVGRYSDEVIVKATRELGSNFSANIFSRIASRENNVRLVLAKVVLGEADAALVYRTDAISGGDKVRIVEIPPRFNVMGSYYIGKTIAAPAAKHAQDFIDLVQSESGVNVLTRHGFQLPKRLQKTPGAP